MARLWVGGLAVALVGMAMGIGPVWADRRRESVPLNQAIACLQVAVAAQPGQVKELDIKQEGSRLVCKVEIISGWEVFEVRVDANTRQVLRVERD
ncbi:MAG: PepSY domain-containing protein [Pseudanabaenaceae cyanobacterium]